MKYRRLGKTELKVSVVGIGTWQYGGEWGMDFTQPDVDAIFDSARDLGINLIDTAECYGDHTSEAFVGNAVQRDRKAWIIATKFGHKFHKPFERTDERSAKDVRPQVEASLAALKTDYIDLLQYHSVRDSEFTDPAVRDELARLVTEGKVRFIGNSIGNAAVAADGSNSQASKSNEFNVSVLQVIYNRLDRRPDEGKTSIFATAQKLDLGILARVPLASGLLSGKYKPGATFPVGDVRNKWKDPNLDAKLNEVEQIARTEMPKGVDMASWALAWCLQHPAVTAVIPGCKNPTQLQQNAAAAELDIVRPDQAKSATTDHRTEIDSVQILLVINSDPLKASQSQPNPFGRFVAFAFYFLTIIMLLIGWSANDSIFHLPFEAAWFVAGCLGLLMSRYRFSQPLSSVGFVRRSLLPIVFLATLIVTCFGLPQELRIRLSRPAMDRFAESVVNGSSGATIPDQRIGLYDATGIMKFVGGFCYDVGNEGFMDRWGFAYSSNGSASLPSGRCDPIGGNWYIWHDHF